MAGIRRAPDTELEAMNASIGARIRALRVASGFSAADVAKHAGVAHQRMHEFEMGHARIGAAQLWRVADLLKVPPGEFFQFHG